MSSGIKSFKIKRNFLTIPFFKKKKRFLTFIMSLFTIALLVHPYPVLAAWFGFFIAGYSAIANDSIQTIGTFISSNQNKKWWVLWLFISTIFFLTVFYSWIVFDGDVSHQRLMNKGFETSPTDFHFLQIAAPIFLLILTRAKMPVSTTFLLLSSFATTGTAIGKVLFKSVGGYFLSFFIAFVIYLLISKYTKKWFTGTPAKGWTIAQWMVSGMLWSIWLQQDAANIAVFLPRSLSGIEFTLFSGFIILGLGVLLYMKGGKIQKIVTEKSEVTDPRFVTIIDGIYAIILFYFKLYNKVPMSTTWVFLGLLAGRELAMSITRTGKKSKTKTSIMILRDASFALFGLIVSIAIATSVNPNIDIKKIPNQFIGQYHKFIDRVF